MTSGLFGGRFPDMFKAVRRFMVAGLLLGLPSIAGQIPDRDVRNSYTPGTDTHFHFTPPSSLIRWEQRRNELRSQILASAGLLPMFEKSELHPQRFGRVDRGSYAIEKVLLDTFPGYYLGGNLYVPASTGRHPAVLLAHGHWPYGRLENESLCSPQLLAAELAREGFVVFMYDMVGYNDTMQTPHRFGDDSERLWSFGPLGLQLWNSTRSLDFLQSLSEVDPASVGIAGPSGGGTQTMMLTAVDARIRFSAPINMVSAYMQGGDVCENAPGLRLGTNNVEIAALAAPRPMFVVSATGDWTKHVPGEEFPLIQQVYRLYGKPENVSVVQFDAPHNLNQQSREAVERFLGGNILHAPGAGQADEKGLNVEQLPDMLALENRTLPKDALSYEGLFKMWRLKAASQLDAISDPEALRTILMRYLGVNWPPKVIREDGQGQGRILLGRESMGDRVPAYYHSRGRTAVMIVDPSGSDAGRKAIETERLASPAQTILSIDAFQTGAANDERDVAVPNFLTFNLGGDQNRVQDILTAIRFLVEEHCSKIELYAPGKAAWWATFAVAALPAVVPVELHLNGGAPAGGEARFISDFNVPGILRAGGLRTAERLLRARDVARSPASGTGSNAASPL